MNEFKYLDHTISLQENENGFFKATPDDCDSPTIFSYSLEELMNLLYEIKHC
jgi:hypothetical protein